MKKVSLSVATIALSVALLTGCANTHKPQGYAKLACPIGGAAVGALAGGVGAVAGFTGGAALCESGDHKDAADKTATQPASPEPVKEPVKEKVVEPTINKIILTGALAKHVHLNDNQTQIIGFDPVHFALDRSQLDDKNRQLLDYYAQVIKDHPVDLMLAGFADSTGTAKYNQQLSERRVQRVKDYLANKNVASAVNRVKAYGQSQPIANNDTPKGRAENRRVELAIQ